MNKQDNVAEYILSACILSIAKLLIEEDTNAGKKPGTLSHYISQAISMVRNHRSGIMSLIK